MVANHERFKNICAGVQSLAIAAAFLVGGAWTAYIFNAEQRVANAKTQLEKLKAELRARSAVNIDLAASQLRIKGDASRYLSVIVSLQNHGTKDTILEFPDKPLTVSRIWFSKDGAQKFHPPLGANTYWIEPGGEQAVSAGQGVRTGDKDDLPFLVRVSEPGVYLVSFNAKLRKEDFGHTVGPNEDQFSNIGVSRYVVVS